MIDEYDEKVRRLGNAIGRIGAAFVSANGSVRLCARCGGIVDGRKRDGARYCSAACRAAASRERAAA